MTRFDRLVMYVILLLAIALSVGMDALFDHVMMLEKMLRAGTDTVVRR